MSHEDFTRPDRRVMAKTRIRLPCPACKRKGLGAVRNSPGIGRNRMCQYCKTRVPEADDRRVLL